MDKNKFLTGKTSFWQRITLVIFGMFLGLVLLEAGLRLSGGVILSLQEYRNMVSVKQRGQYRILCLGESTTQGQYPVFLEEILNQRNLGIKFSVIDKGLAGTTTGMMVSQLESNLDKYHPDLVVTMVGINDYSFYAFSDAVLALKITGFFKSLKIYKLAESLWLHIKVKIEEKEFINTPKKAELKSAYAQQEDFTRAEKALKKAIELNPKNDRAYTELGIFYLEQGRFFEVESLFKKAIALNYNNKLAYAGLGWLYQQQGRLAEDEKLFKQAIDRNPNSSWAYTGLGAFYQQQNRFPEAERLFKQAIALNSNNAWAYAGLGWIYRRQGKLFEAEEYFKQAIALNCANNLKNEWGDRALKSLYREMNRADLEEEYAKKVTDEYGPLTVDNYRKLKAILDKRGIRLVCVQYPMRSIEPLKKIFAGEPGVIFVDNERLFKDAVAQGGYKEYFRDMFAGDFGHCTAKGNRLLAENVAEMILK
jgi:Flp pilus assembly protein TadD